MKTLKRIKRIPLLIFTIGLLALATKAVPPSQITWGIWFDTPTNMPVLNWWVPGTNQAYKLYGTSSPGMPVANYPLLAMWTNWLLFTNTATGNIYISNNITVAAKQYFFLVNPTNTWGELPFGDFGQQLSHGSTVVNSDGSNNREVIQQLRGRRTVPLPPLPKNHRCPTSKR